MARARELRWMKVNPAGHKWSFPGLSIRVNIFINYLEKGMECIFSQFADSTNLGRNVNLWRVGMFCRGIWIGWIHGPKPIVWGATRPSAESYWVTTTPCRLGDEWLGHCLVEKDQQVLVDSWLNLTCGNWRSYHSLQLLEVAANWGSVSSPKGKGKEEMASRCQKRFRLGIRRNLFMERAVKH